MFCIPPYIDNTKLAGKPIDFDWVGDNPTEYHNHISNQLTDKIMSLSPRAALALANGLAEWVVWRLDGLTDYRDVADFVEAGWASVIDARYTIEWSRQGKELFGPVLGPQWIAARSLDQVMIATWERESQIRSCQYLAFLCQHVWKRRKAFKEWLLFAFDRLESLYPISSVTQDYYEMRNRTGDEPFDFGEPVPREVLDPDFELDAESVPALLDAYLRDLKPEENRFLRTPKQLLELGFEGKPYRYPPQTTYSKEG